MKLGKQLVDLRNTNGLSLDELSTQLNIPSQEILKWESDESVPTLDDLIKLKDIYRISLDNLILGKEKPITLHEQFILDLIRKIVSWGLILIGSVILLLAPLMAEIYRNYIFASKGRALTESFLYLSQWPLCGVLVISIALIGIGIILKYSKRIKNALHETMSSFFQS